MKIYYDVKVDAIYIEIRPLMPGGAENRELTEDIIANYASDGKLAGIEILNVSLLLGKEPQNVIVEVSPVYVERGLRAYGETQYPQVSCPAKGKSNGKF